MKKILLAICLIPLFSLAQKSEVVIDSADMKPAIYSKSLLWVSKTWKDAVNVIDMKDESSGVIVVKGGLVTVPKSLGIPAKGITLTQLTIHVKDGKAKLDFENTNFKWATGTVWNTTDDKSAGQFTKWRDAVLKEIADLIESYKIAVAKKDADF